MQYSSSLAGLTPELVELLLSHMARERLLRPRTLELFFGCPLQKFVLNCYPYSTNELLRQLRAFTALKHLSLINSHLITGTEFHLRRGSEAMVTFMRHVWSSSVLFHFDPDSGLSILSSLVKLQSLNLASCSKLTDSCLQHITGQTFHKLLAVSRRVIGDNNFNYMQELQTGA